MTIDVPDYIEERLRRIAPEGCRIVAHYGVGDRKVPVPTISYGDVRTARVATISLNPLNFDQPATADFDYLHKAEPAIIQAIFEDNITWFEREGWSPLFGKLEKVLNGCGFSYGPSRGAHAKASAVALDLVQWSTNPKWSGLRQFPGIQERLLQEDQGFFEALLRKNANIELVICNGQRVIEELKSRHHAKFEEQIIEPFGKRKFRLSYGEVYEKKAIGWSPWIQRLADEAKPLIAEKVKSWGILP